MQINDRKLLILGLNLSQIGLILQIHVPSI